MGFERRKLGKMAMTEDYTEHATNVHKYVSMAAKTVIEWTDKLMGIYKSNKPIYKCCFVVLRQIVYLEYRPKLDHVSY